MWGGEIPALGEADYTVSGLAAGEALKTLPTIAYEATPDMMAEGAVAIIVSGAEAPAGGNYHAIAYTSGTLHIKALPVVAPIDPPDPEEAQDSTKDFRIGFTANYKSLAEIRLNGTLLTRTPTDDTTSDLSGWPGYEGVLGKAESGSVYITLYKEFLQTLPNGQYTLALSVQEGSATGAGNMEFTLAQGATPAPTAVPEATPTPTPTAAPETTPTPVPTTAPEATPTPSPTAAPVPGSTAKPGATSIPENGPQTGHSTNTAPWVLLLLLSAGGMGTLTWIRRKKT